MTIPAPIKTLRISVGRLGGGAVPAPGSLAAPLEV
jgi:hypothetical protein